MIQFHLHSNIYSDDQVHVLCPPKLMIDVVHALLKVDDAQVIGYESVIKVLDELKDKESDK